MTVNVLILGFVFCTLSFSIWNVDNSTFHSLNPKVARKCDIYSNMSSPKIAEKYIYQKIFEKVIKWIRPVLLHSYLVWIIFETILILMHRPKRDCLVLFMKRSVRLLFCCQKTYSWPCCGHFSFSYSFTSKCSFMSCFKVCLSFS